MTITDTRFPEFYLIGGQKCGSTYLHRVLAEHPEVYMPAAEIRYLDDFDFTQKEIDGLQSLFENQDPQAFWGIKSPELLVNPVCASRIQQLRPDARIIAILRNPVERAVSAYFHYVRYGFIPPLPLNIGMEKVLDGNWGKYTTVSREIINYGFYADNLERFQSHFGEENLRVFLFDDLKGNKKEVIQEAYQFLAVDTDFVPEKALNKKPTKGIYSLFRQKWLAMRHSRMYRYYANHTRFEPRNMSAWDRLICRVIQQIDRKILDKVLPGKKPVLNQELKSRLYERYADDIRRLEHMLDRELPKWHLK